MQHKTARSSRTYGLWAAQATVAIKYALASRTVTAALRNIASKQDETVTKTRTTGNE
jgi:hypothetical protein